MKKLSSHIFRLVIVTALFVSCNKDPEFIDDNSPPNLNNVPTVLIENYVNRVFIDLIGREPLDAEMDSNVAFFKANELSFEARELLIEKLQTDTAWVEGDTSYRYAYYQRFYDMAKVRMIEGDGDDQLNRWISQFQNTILRDSLNGDTTPTGNAISTARAQLEIEKLWNVLKIKRQYREDSIQLDEIFQRLANNYIYDQINMNTFNFINATFDNLFNRFPTDAEFWSVWEMVENNNSTNLFGQNGQTKGQYLEILTGSREFYEGLIIWAYLNLMAREPATSEVNDLIDEFYFDQDFQKVQKAIMITDEYANF